ncbi:MAG TPA: reverse transcriptase domain-containing protein [Thermoanaerobaculia bacterium]|nr:reverse transcriptase domain-containing protein [Thermoanaerobaculia bacterium]
MKTFSTPLEAIASPESLLAAWRQYRSGKRRRPAVAWFELDAERNLLNLSEALQAGTYRHGRYHVLEIRDPKPRLIAVASVGDRVVHRAVHAALAPLFDCRFIADSYACLPGRGSHRALLRFLELQRRFPRVMHLDVSRYFPSIDHAILLSLLSEKLRDRRVVALLTVILASGHELYLRPSVASFYGLDREEQRRRPCGLPIGNLTSQWWGNLYLDGFDHFVKRELKAEGYLRYMDDLVFFAHERSTLRAWRRAAEAWLSEQRRLALNLRKGHIRPTELPQNYLGHRVTRQGCDLGTKAVRRFRKRLPELALGDQRRFRQSLVSWRGAVTF